MAKANLMSEVFLLAVDVGTSALKVVVYDVSGKVLKNISRRYDYTIPQPGQGEIDPLVWWDALKEVFHQIKGAGDWLSNIKVIALTGQMHSAVLLDEAYYPAAPTILWLDRRAAAETAELQQELNLPAYHLNSTYTLPKLLWLKRHRPEVLEKTRYLLWPKDYLRFCLTGEILTDFTEAGGAALLDWNDLDWATERLKGIGIDPGILPPLRNPQDEAGHLRKEICDEFGFSAGTKVIVGAGDVLALVSGAPPAYGRVTCSMGTSSMIFCPVLQNWQAPQGEDRLYTYPLLPYKLLGGVSSTTGASLTWIANTLYSNGTAFEEMIAESISTQPGSGGLFFLPYLSGERSPYWNDRLRGGFYGLTLSHQKPQLVRAVLEGLGYSLRRYLDIYQELGVEITEIALAGGGGAITGLAQIFADVCQIPVVTFSGVETVTRGLYAYACAAMGIDSFETAINRTFEEPVKVSPDVSRRELYQSLYTQFRELSEYADKTLSRL